MPVVKPNSIVADFTPAPMLLVSKSAFAIIAGVLKTLFSLTSRSVNTTSFAYGVSVPASDLPEVNLPLIVIPVLIGNSGSTNGTTVSNIIFRVDIVKLSSSTATTVREPRISEPTNPPPYAVPESSP